MPKLSKVLRRVPVPSRVERTLETALDRALAVQRPMVLGYIDRVRSKRPQMTPSELTEQLERRYRQAVMAIGGASGAASAVPGVGTAASLASGAAEITAFVSASAMYVLALAELHSVPVSDPQIRRALVLSVLVGEGGAAIVAGADAGRVHWAQALGRGASKDKIAMINSRLARRSGRRHARSRRGWSRPRGVLPVSVGLQRSSRRVTGGSLCSWSS